MIGFGGFAITPALAFSAFTSCCVAAILTGAKMQLQLKTHCSFTSDDRGTSMIFLNPGSYSATLTATDAQGHTAQNTVWITVLKYPPNPPPDYDTHRLIAQISRRT